ncbi:MAG: LacI family DNA-binding transcriptional regulator [Paracoccaceae bacterium]
MTHRFPIKEIARQACISTATVDRVLNKRPNVSPQTRNRVRAAIQELRAQEDQMSARGRRLFVDIVAEAPARFTNEIRTATEAVLPTLGSGVFRPRFTFHERFSDTDTVTMLRRIGKRGSHGVCLKVRDTPIVTDAVQQLVVAGIPVVTLVTDLPHAHRSNYIGLDNANAGRTAAYLLAKTVRTVGGTVLTTRSQTEFHGEAERHVHFCETLAISRPDLSVADFSGGAGLSSATTLNLAATLGAIHDPVAVYSMGGGNDAILKHLDERGYTDLTFIAHDLDSDNRSLLQKGRINFLLNHDLQTDMRHVFHALAAHHGLAVTQSEFLNSDVQIITPFNIPA